MARHPTAFCALLVLLAACSFSACQRGSDSASLMADARRYHQRGENKAAIIQLKNILQAQPANIGARALLAEVYLDAGDALSAEKEWHKAQALGMPVAAVAPGLGQALLMRGQFAEVLALAPAGVRDEAPALTLLRANALLGQGHADQAAPLFEAVATRQPALAAPLLGLARIATLASQQQRALVLCQQALARQPQDIDTLRLRGDLLRLRGDSAGAAASYRSILAVRPEHVQAHLDLANLAIQDGRGAEAQTHIDAARRSAPANLLASYTQALLDFRLGKNKEALDAVQQVLRVAPEHMPSVLLLGSIQLALGATEQAQDALQHFLDAYPQHLYASKSLAAVALRSGQYPLALQVLTPLLASHADDVELLSLAADAHLRSKHYAEGRALLEKAAALAPRSAALRTALGASQLATGNTARAITELQRATTLDGDRERAGILLVMEYLHQQDTDRALDAVNRMQQREPGSALVANLQGGVLLARRDLVHARASLERALRLTPDYFPALDNLTQIDIAEKKPAQARQRLLQALQRRPEDGQLQVALSRLAASQQQLPEARDWLERANRAHPADVAIATQLCALYVRLGTPQSAVRLAQRLQSSRPDQAEPLALLADVQAATGDPHAAIASYGKLAVLQPASATIQLSIARLQQADGKTDDALRAVQKALVIQSTLLAAEITEVELLIQQGAWLQADAAAVRVQRRHPALPAGFKLAGDVAMAQQKWPSAVRAYEQALAISTTGPLLINLHQALTQSGRAREADRRLSTWLAQQPDDTAARLYLAGVKLRAGEHAAAIPLYQAVLALQPGNVIAQNDLAWTYLQAGDARALPAAEQAQRLAPDNPGVIDTLGWIVLQQGDAARALPLLQRAAKLDPARPDIRYHLGLALIKAGNTAAARSQLQQLLSSNASFPQRAEVTALLAHL